MDQRFYDMFESNPVIAAVKDVEGLEKCCSLEDIKVVFILFGDICSIPDIVEKIKTAGKMAVVHVDLIGGLSPREIAVDFIKNNTEADGIISTKPALIRRGKEFDRFYGARKYQFTAERSQTGCNRDTPRTDAGYYQEDMQDFQNTDHCRRADYR